MFNATCSQIRCFADDDVSSSQFFAIRELMNGPCNDMVVVFDERGTHKRVSARVSSHSSGFGVQIYGAFDWYSECKSCSIGYRKVIQFQTAEFGDEKDQCTHNQMEMKTHHVT